jgi:phage terminase large subunit
MLKRVQWPPDYDAEVKRRHRLLVRMHNMSAAQVAGAIKFYSSGLEGCIAFMEDWCETFDPRNAGTGRSARMPMKMFPKQMDLIEFLYACYSEEANGLIEKSRDMGATWCCVNFSLWLFLFQSGATIGWGSRKAALVDKLGDMDSIFEKIRFQMLSVPVILWPKNFDPSEMMGLMKIYDPSGNAITGEAGDDIGRGGRKRVYFKDESAHYEHPEMIDAALDDNTRCQIDISSVNGLGNVFHTKRENGVEWSPGQPAVRGKTNVFVMDWSDHPAKTQEWYQRRREESEDKGLLHKFSQEVDRNYSAAVVGVIVPAEWVQSAIDAHVKLGLDTGRGWHAGLDVADEGGDTNALVTRRGILVQSVDEWGAPDVGATTRRAIGILQDLVPQNTKGRRPVRVYYDSVGVGAGVKAESNRLSSDELPDHERMPAGMKFFSWNAGAKPQDPDAKVEETDDGEVPTNAEFFQNLKAQGWWGVRRRFEKTHRCVTEGKLIFPVEELISIPSTLPMLRKLQKELSQATSKKSSTMKLLVDKKPPGTKSPNTADALVECFTPVENTNYDSSMDWL